MPKTREMEAGVARARRDVKNLRGDRQCNCLKSLLNIRDFFEDMSLAITMALSRELFRRGLLDWIQRGCPGGRQDVFIHIDPIQHHCHLARNATRIAFSRRVTGSAWRNSILRDALNRL